MKMSGVLVEKVPKTYFVGVAWTLFTPLRDTISVSSNRITFSGITIFMLKFRKNRCAMRTWGLMLKFIPFGWNAVLTYQCLEAELLQVKR